MTDSFVMKKGAPRLLVMAGGTGGHVYPALAVAEAMRAKGWLVDWVGTERGLESRVVPSNDFALHVLPVRGLRGKGLLFKAMSAGLLVASLFESLLLIRRLHPDVVLGMGGYVAGPAGIAAWLLRKPLVIHEQNAVAGTTNRWLAPLARRVLCGLSGAFDDVAKAQLVGNPVRKEIVACFDAPALIPSEFSAERPLRLLVLGGSLGSIPLNEGVPAALETLNDEQLGLLSVHHQCGSAHHDITVQRYSAVAKFNVDVMPFVDDMSAAYQWADLVICRAGALTVAELAVTGTPSILVPLPHAIDDHQTRNAQALSSQGAAQLVRQIDMTPARLGKLITSYLEIPSRLQMMAAKARDVAKPQATDAVVGALEEVAHAA